MGLFRLAERLPDASRETAGVLVSGKPGSKSYILSERTSIPLSVADSAANTHDSHALEPLANAIPAIKSRRGPRRLKSGKLHADKAYDQTDLHRWVAVLANCG